MSNETKSQSLLGRLNGPSLKNWGKPDQQDAENFQQNSIIDCGWGRLLFGHTFLDHKLLLNQLREENPKTRDIAIYIRDPHVVLSLAPQELFLDPSHTYRLWFENYLSNKPKVHNLFIRPLQNSQDIEAVNQIYMSCHMIPLEHDTLVENQSSDVFTYLLAMDTVNQEVVGTVIGIDHKQAFNDPEEGSSLWCLAVHPQASLPGVGEALVRHLIDHFRNRGRKFMDISVLHNNERAIALYERLRFERVPVFSIKRKNPINEKLFIAPEMDHKLNPYAMIIIDEARRRGIGVQVIDRQSNIFRLSFGGRSILCHESLSEMTSAVAMSFCQNKVLTQRILKAEGIPVPDQLSHQTWKQDYEFLAKHERIVIKPAMGEQGQGVTVDVRTDEVLEASVERAKKFGEVILEEFIEGQDLRVVMIDFKVVAAAIRKPPEVLGTGEHTVRDLIQKQSRRRAAATGGESRIPMDEETERCVKSNGFGLDDVLPAGKTIAVRKTANLHTGGTIHDVTDAIHWKIIETSELASRALNIPVVGLDFMVPHPTSPEHYFIEANERPGLANHEPQPTAERFVDLLFPHSVFH